MTPWRPAGRLGLGCAALGGLYEVVDEGQAAATVDAAWEAGIRFFDTAPLYGHGLSEQRLGRALASRRRDEYVLCTKVGRVLEPTVDGRAPEGTIFAGVPPLDPVFDFSRDGVRRSLDASLDRLGVDFVDVVHVHDPEDHLEQAVEEAYPALASLRDEGVIGAIGLGTNHAETGLHLIDRVELDCLLLAGRCTLLDRSGEEALLPRCEERGIAVIAGGVFNSGLLADPKPGAPFHYGPAPDDVVARAQVLRDRSASHGVPLGAAALQHPGRLGGVEVVLFGARSPEEVRTDVALASLPVPDALWEDLRRP